MILKMNSWLNFAKCYLKRFFSYVILCISNFIKLWRNWSFCYFGQICLFEHDSGYNRYTFMRVTMSGSYTDLFSGIPYKLRFYICLTLSNYKCIKLDNITSSLNIWLMNALLYQFVTIDMVLYFGLYYTKLHYN